MMMPMKRLLLSIILLLFQYNIQSIHANQPSFDRRPVLTRHEAKKVYDNFAKIDHAGGKDASTGYGGPAVKALIQMAKFDRAHNVLEYGCGQGKLAELVIQDLIRMKKEQSHQHKEEEEDPLRLLQRDFSWRGIDQSPNMVQKFQERCVNQFGSNICSIEYLESGDPTDVDVKEGSVDRFVSTYCLDLMSEDDIYAVLDKAAKCLHQDDGLILLAGITWGYKKSLLTALTTAIWEMIYNFRRTIVGGCRPQALVPYLKACGWRIEEVVETLPTGYPWMASEIISARPPLTK